MIPPWKLINRVKAISITPIRFTQLNDVYLNVLSPSSLFQDAIQAQMVIAKMSELGMGENSTEQQQIIEEQPIYANTEDGANANDFSAADRENNTIPVRY